MSIPPLDPLKTINPAQVRRLQLLGATVTKTTVTATEAQMWLARIIGNQRRLLELRGNMAKSKEFP